MNQGDNDAGRVAGSFTFQAQMPNGKSLSFSGYVLAGQTPEEVNRHLDMAAAVVERQRLAAEIPTLETKLIQTEDTRRQLIEIISELSSKERPTSQEKNHLNTHRVNLQNVERQIVAGQEAIAEARRSLAA